MRIVTARNFTQSVVSSNVPVVVLFAEDSAECRAAERKLGKVAAIFAGPINFLYANVESDPELASAHLVRRTPLVVVFTDGHERWRAEGRLQEHQLEELRRMLMVGSSAPPRATTARMGRSMLGRAKASVKRLASSFIVGQQQHKHKTPAFGPEEAFERETVIPLLNRWELPYRSQAYCVIRKTGRRGRIDFLVNCADNSRPLTLFEDKASIRTDSERERAVVQANAYARSRRLPSFVIAAPEGMWIYSRPGGKPKLERSFSPAEVAAGVPEAKQLLIELSRRPWTMTGNQLGATIVAGRSIHG